MLAAVCSLCPVSRAPAALPPPPPPTHCHSASPPFLALLLPVRSIPSTSSPSCYGLLCKSVGSLFSFYCEPDFLAWQTEGGKKPEAAPCVLPEEEEAAEGGEHTVHTPGPPSSSMELSLTRTHLSVCGLFILSGWFCCPVCAFFFKLSCCLSFSESDVTTTVLF